MERDGVKDANTATCTTKEATRVFCLVYRSKGKPNLQCQPTDYKKVKGTFFIHFLHEYDKPINGWFS